MTEKIRLKDGTELSLIPMGITESPILEFLSLNPNYPTRKYWASLMKAI